MRTFINIEDLDEKQQKAVTDLITKYRAENFLNALGKALTAVGEGFTEAVKAIQGALKDVNLEDLSKEVQKMKGHDKN